MRAGSHVDKRPMCHIIPRDSSIMHTHVWPTDRLHTHSNGLTEIHTRNTRYIYHATPPRLTIIYVTRWFCKGVLQMEAGRIGLPHVLVG